MNISTHPATPEEIMAYLDGELPPADAQTLAGHLKQCAACAAVADEFQATAQALAGWNVPATAVHLDQARIERAAGNRVRGGAPSHWKPWVLGGGALAAAAVLFLIVSPFAPPPSTLDRQARPAVYPERPLDARKPDRAVPENSGSAGGVLGGIGNTAPPQIAGIAGMAAPMRMLKEQAAPPPAMAMKAGAYAPSRTIGGGGGGGMGTAAPAAPMIARTVAFTLRVDDIATARGTLDRIVSRYQGYTAELTFAAAEAGFPTLQASLRIPAPELAAAVGELKTLGEVEDETQTGEELSQQHQDLLARLKNSRATEDRFRAILQQHTGSVSSILEVEQAIATVREEIERMEAEQQALEHRVTFATVNLRLVSRASVRPYVPTLSSRLRDAFAAGHRNAVETLFGIALFFAEYGLTLLIWLVLLGVPALLLFVRYRRIRPRR